MDFDNAASLESVQVIELKKEDYKKPEQEEKGNAGTAVIPLKFVKFQNVNVLNIFIESNLGDSETTAIGHLTVLGDPSRTITKMKEVIS